MFFNARWFDQALGRFIQADSIIPNPGNPQSLDRYAYVLNNPVNFTDPSGHKIDDGCGTEGCDASQAEINYDAKRNYYQSCKDEGTCPDYAGAITFAAVGLVTAGAVGPVIDTIGGTVAGWVPGATTAACADGDCTNEVQQGYGALEKAAEYGIKGYKEMQNALRGTGLFSHHIIPTRFAPNLGLDPKQWVVQQLQLLNIQNLHLHGRQRFIMLTVEVH
jgi:hypothetical protein